MPAFIPRRPRPAPGGKWGSFASIIAQDDAAMMERGRESIENLGGTSFRPALKETYKPHGGEKSETVYEEIPGNRKRVEPAAAAAVEGTAVATPVVKERSVAEKTAAEKSAAPATEFKDTVTQQIEGKEPAREQALSDGGVAIAPNMQNPTMTTKQNSGEKAEKATARVRKAVSKCTPYGAMKLDASWLPAVVPKITKLIKRTETSEPCKKTLNKRKKRASKDRKRARKAKQCRH